MRKPVRIRISEYHLARNGEPIKSYGLGSCVGVAIYDPRKKIGALAHILLPAGKNSKKAAGSAKYASSAVALMVEELLKAGCDPRRLRAKMAGGANMFPRQFNVGGRPGADIGRRNIRAAAKALAQKNIPLAAAEVGGETGRTIEFNPATGELRIYQSTGEVKII